MQYVKLDQKNDIEKLINSRSNNFWNNYLNNHYFTTCSNCGKEYLLINSPVLHNELWEKILDRFNLQEQQKLSYSESQKLKLLTPEKRHLHILTKPIENCNVCQDCMELALGRKLDIIDLKKCDMNTRLIKLGKINS